MVLRSRYLMVDRRGEVWRVSGKLAAEVLAVAGGGRVGGELGDNRAGVGGGVGGGRIGAELVDNRQVVVERVDGRESGGLGIAVVAAGSGEYEGCGDDVERDALLMERSRQSAIGGPRPVGRVGDAAVKVEDAPDIDGGGHGCWPRIEEPEAQARGCLPAAVGALSLGLGCEAKTSR